MESVVREVLESEPCELSIGQEKQIILTAYAYDVAVIAESEDNLKRTTKILMIAAKNIGLVINESKIKLMIVSRRDRPQTTITIKDLENSVIYNTRR